MTIEEDFPGLPPFPKDVKTFPVPILSWGKLLAEDKIESERMFEACKDQGVFQLNLGDTPKGRDLLADVDDVFSVSKDLFNVDVEEKERYKMSAKTTFGYKGVGKIVIDDKGTPDRNEFFAISKDEMFGNTDAAPTLDIVNANKRLLRSYMSSAHEVVITVLSALETHLHLPRNTLVDIHRLSEIDGNQTRLFLYSPQPSSDRRTSLVPHTDFGSVTVLFNRLGGLQILPSNHGGAEAAAAAEWAYIRPLPSHAIVNMGDALVKFTHGLLKSLVHRVTYAPGAQASVPRYSMVYLARPSNDVILKRLEGSDVIPPLDEGEVEEDISSADWIANRVREHHYGTSEGT
ncbi:MAG: hypothetical protein M1837_005233 [Sclerophora amabilis]|nr:MAG: hypothetical protein M1837_005233 [Sclerophora amabilis]